jgi:two-component system sensor histidine kinase ChvG
MAVVLAVSIFLSLFLARTIVRPLRRLALAAHRVRLGRSREVNVPRLPSRSDEIGLLARAVSDMSQSLRHRIDNIEAFAADVTHELKNPLASLRSAVDGLDRVEDPALREKLKIIVREDVARLDRLISDISEAARTDAELARATFERVDLGALVQQLVHSWETRRETGDARLAFARPRKDTAAVMGKPDRLARAINAIIDNAVSFSPPGGLVEIAVARVGDEVRIRIDDEGPGVPPEAREAIFNRFHSVRPEGENFGRHSGLGLAIAQAIVNGHDGEIDVQDRDDAPSGARFTIKLPAADRARTSRAPRPDRGFPRKPSTPARSRATDAPSSLRARRDPVSRTSRCAYSTVGLPSSATTRRWSRKTGTGFSPALRRPSPASSRSAASESSTWSGSTTFRSPSLSS